MTKSMTGKCLISEKQVSLLKYNGGVEVYVNGYLIETFNEDFEDIELVKEVLRGYYGYEFIEDMQEDEEWN